jgi:hypothetical protein
LVKTKVAFWCVVLARLVTEIVTWYVPGVIVVADVIAAPASVATRSKPGELLRTS